MFNRLRKGTSPFFLKTWQLYYKQASVKKDIQKSTLHEHPLYNPDLR